MSTEVKKYELKITFRLLTLWHPLLPYWYSILCQTGLSHHL